MRQPGSWLWILLVLFTAFQVAAESGSSQKYGSLEGQVTDSMNGDPLPWATVTIVNGLGRVRADSTGRFIITDLPPGTYALRVSHVGYQTRTSGQIEVKAGETSVARMELTLETTSIKTIVVTPGRFNLGAEPTSPQTLSREEITSVPQLADDFFRSTVRLPGMASNDFSTRFTVRGGEYDEILVTLDGLELYEPFHMKDFDGGAISILDGSVIEGIELITGGFPAKYGNKLSGVFDINTRREVPERSTLSAGISLINLRALAEGPLPNRKGSWMFSVRRGYIDVVLSLVGASNEMKPRYYDILGKVDYQLGASHVLGVHMLHARDTYSYVGEDYSEDANDTLNSEYSNSYAWVTLDSRLHPRLTARTVASVGRLNRSRKGQQYLSGVEVVAHRVSDDAGSSFGALKTDIDYEISNQLLVQWGAEYRPLRSDYDYLSRRFAYEWQPAPGGWEYTLVRIDTTDTRMEPKGHQLGAYISTRLNIGKPFTAEVGWRYDKASYSSDEVTSPRVGGVYRFNPGTSLRAAWGEYYQSQGIHEILVSDGESSFSRAQKAEHYMAGFEHRFVTGTELRIELYHKKYHNLRPDLRNAQNPIELFPEHEEDRQIVYRGSAVSKGIEFYLKRDAGTRLSWWTSYAYAKVEEAVDSIFYPLQNTSGYFRETLNSPRDLTHTFYFDVVYRPSSNWQVNAAFQYHTGWPFTDLRLLRVRVGPGEYVNFITPDREWAARFEPFHRLDLRLTRHFRWGNGQLKLFAELLNVYGRKNVRTYSYLALDTPRGTTLVREPEEYWFGRMPSFGVSYEVAL